MRKKKRWTIPSVGENVEKSEPSYAAGENVTWYRCSGKEFGGSSKSYTLSYHMTQPFHFWVDAQNK